MKLENCYKINPTNYELLNLDISNNNIIYNNTNYFIL